MGCIVSREVGSSSPRNGLAVFANDKHSNTPLLHVKQGGARTTIVDRSNCRLTARERKLIVESWKNLVSRNVSLSEGFAECLINQRHHNDNDNETTVVDEDALAKHGVYVAQTIAICVNKINFLEAYAYPELKKLGRVHVRVSPSGITREYWDAFNHGIIQCILDVPDVKNKKEAEHAWKKLITWIVSCMQCGYYETKSRLDAKERGRENSSGTIAGEVSSSESYNNVSVSVISETLSSYRDGQAPRKAKTTGGSGLVRSATMKLRSSQRKLSHSKLPPKFSAAAPRLQVGDYDLLTAGTLTPNCALSTSSSSFAMLSPDTRKASVA